MLLLLAVPSRGEEDPLLPRSSGLDPASKSATSEDELECSSSRMPSRMESRVMGPPSGTMISREADIPTTSLPTSSSSADLNSAFNVEGNVRMVLVGEDKGEYTGLSFSSSSSEKGDKGEGAFADGEVASEMAEQELSDDLEGRVGCCWCLLLNFSASSLSNLQSI